jgi:hypothetical protein
LKQAMPIHMPPTMAEREAELAALQSAFDEYIASSRELEEELDAELAKMRKSWSTTLTLPGCHIPVFLVFRVLRDDYFEFPIQEGIFVFRILLFCIRCFCLLMTAGMTMSLVTHT